MVAAVHFVLYAADESMTAPLAVPARTMLVMMRIARSVVSPVPAKHASQSPTLAPRETVTSMVAMIGMVMAMIATRPMGTMVEGEERRTDARATEARKPDAIAWQAR